jgi:hypothetical protein
MSHVVPQLAPTFLGDAAGMLYVTVPQLLAVALMVGGIGILLWAARRGSEPPATAQKPGRRSPELDEVMSDARELADLLADRMDRQAQRLERLIEEADEKIRRLERMQTQGVGTPQYRAEADPMNQQVYDLADEGHPPVEIARRLQQHTGKVELILALRRR